MKKIIIAVVFILLMIGITVFLIIPNKKMIPQTAQQQSTDSSIIKDAVLKSKNLICSYRDEEGRDAKVYLKNGMVRSDFVAKNNNDDSESSIINIKDKKMYVWNSKKEGYVITVSDAIGSDQSEKDSVYKMVDNLYSNEKSCKSGDIADSLFTPPSNVKFEDYTQSQGVVVDSK